MKKRRQAKILELIKSKDIQTQEDLQDELKDGGYDVTQATISRDIKELQLIKGLSASSGKYVYCSGKKQQENFSKRAGSIFCDSVISAEYALNTVVIKCFAGMANAACAAIDSMSWDGVLGTIAGDDTIFVLCHSEEYANLFTVNLRKMLDA